MIYWRLGGHLGGSQWKMMRGLGEGRGGGGGGREGREGRAGGTEGGGGSGRDQLGGGKEETVLGLVYNVHSSQGSC